MVVTGGTGYVGRPLIANLVSRGHRVVALARTGSQHRVPTGAAIVEGSALVVEDVARALTPGCTLVLLVGHATSGPWYVLGPRPTPLGSWLALGACG